MWSPARGIGAIGALFAAVDGAQRLWDDKGFWRSRRVAAFYPWRSALRLVGAAAGCAVLLVAVPLAVVAAGFVVFPIDFVLKLVGVSAASAPATAYSALVGRAFAPSALPTWLPRLAVLALSIALAVAAGAAWVERETRQARGAAWWRLLRGPLSEAPAVDHCWTMVWDLVRGAAALRAPAPVELGRRYTELLADNLGQPGFRELLVAAHDIDAGRDIVFALLTEPRRIELLRRATTEAAEERRAEVVDLAGLGREHLTDAVMASLAIPLATDPHTIAFDVDSYWRGEHHRLTDRPGSLQRLVEELAGLEVDADRPGVGRLRLAGSPCAVALAARSAWPGRRVPALGGGGRCARCRQAPGRGGAADLRHPARAQSGRTVRFRGRLRRSIRPPPSARGADEPRVRGCLPPVHRADRRRERRAGRAGGAMKPATKLIHAGERTIVAAAPLTTPIYETSTFVFDTAQEVVAYNEGRSSKYLYSRYGNPTSRERRAEARGARRCGGGAAVLVRAWRATATILMAHLKSGDEVVCSAAIYGGTLHLLHDLLSALRHRLAIRVARGACGAPERLIGDRTRILWFESPINPTLRCVDVRRIAAACRARGVLSVIDNTFASPINQQPLALGVDLAMQSATKYLNGHSDVTGGVVTGPTVAPGADREGAADARDGDGSACRRMRWVAG